MTKHEAIIIDGPEDGVRRITLNRPDKRNALNARTLAEIAEVLADADTDDHVRAIVMTGGEKVFAAGADLKEMAAMNAIDVHLDARARQWATIRRFSKPIVAAVNGFALGGGCELAMHADIIVAGESAQFGQPEVNLGIMPGAGGTQRLTRTVGKSVAMKMVLSGLFIDAAEALATGLVAEVVEDGQSNPRAVELAALIATKPPLAVRMAKEAVLKSYEMPLESALDFERRAFTVLSASDDRNEGIAAFFDKRKADFKGR